MVKKFLTKEDIEKIKKRGYPSELACSDREDKSFSKTNPDYSNLKLLWMMVDLSKPLSNRIEYIVWWEDKLVYRGTDLDLAIEEYNKIEIREE